MQLTGGQFKGRKLDVPEDVKPTLSKVRESVFNILKSELGFFENLTFLDMFAGSGVMALEALSRGFNVTAIEQNRLCIASIKSTLLKLDSQIRLISADSSRAIKKLGGFDVIYIDPPWEYDYSESIALAANALSRNGIIICESDNKKPTLKEIPSGGIPSNVKLYKKKIYGRCKLSFYKLNVV